MSHFAAVAAHWAMRITRFLSSLAVLALAVPLAGLGCNAKVATILESDDSGTAPGPTGGEPGTDAGTTVIDTGTSAPDCAAKGGSCIPLGQTPKSPHRQAAAGEASCSGTDVCWFATTIPSKGPVCYNDQGCNSDPGASSLWGTCFGGLCICGPGFHVQPDGRCGKTLPPDCTTQAGKCTQQPAICPAGSLESAQETNMSCGDLIAAVCCLAEATCGGPAREIPGGGWTPIEMICCAPNDAANAPICVNGWQTCRPGETAVDKSFGGCG